MWPLALLAALGSACAPKRVSLPADSGSPFPAFSEVHTQISAACRGVRTITAELSLAGRAGAERLRGRVVSGFARPASMRLEGVAPFGPPAFILVARGETATLLLPRDNGVLRGAKAQDILGALTGVALAPADLQAILTGCVLETPVATAGRTHPKGWASIELAGGATLYLQRQGSSWVLRAARRGDWRIDYPAWQGSFPRVVRLQSGAAAAVDLEATIAQLEANIDLDTAVFDVVVPADSTPITLDQLRGAGPLRGQ
ncbi:MAG: hypothetical protein ABL993_02835 [Vicinamibacterales bacterium]